jgi:hypothetical protein
VIPNIGGMAAAIISARATTMGMFIAGFCVGGFGFGSQGLFLAVVSKSYHENIVPGAKLLPTQQTHSDLYSLSA